MKKTIFLGFIITAIAFLLVGCSKDDAGPAGPAGNANVKTYTYSVTNADWIPDSVNHKWTADHTFASSVDFSGAVLLYVQDGSNWAALPRVNFGISFEYGFDLSTKIMEVQAADVMSMTLVANPGSMNFKVVTIPIVSRLANPNLDLKNYKAVKAAFNIK